jgi:hypothetical protein
MLYNAFKPGRSQRKYGFLLAPKRCKHISRTSLFRKLQMMNIEVNLWHKNTFLVIYLSTVNIP